MDTQSTLFAEDFLASLSVSPGSDEAMKMTASSGRKCAELLKRSDRAGLLVKMLLESSQWHSTMCYLTWKDSATPGGRLLFRLVPKMAATEEIACSFWRTPQAHNGAQGPKSKEFFEHCLETGQSAITLTDQVRHAPSMWPTPKATLRGDCPSERQRHTPDLHAAVHMWPTPQAQNSKGIDPQYCVNKDGDRPKPGEKIYDSRTGNQVQSSLDQVLKLWPTPQARDYRSADTVESPRGQRKTEQGWTTDLNDAVKLWPTPRSSDGKHGGPNQRDSRGNHALPGAVHHQPEEVKGQLNPDWEETLMTLPVGWTDVDVANEDLYMLAHPAPFGCDQYDFEPPRVTSVKKNRSVRVKAIGNAVSPTQIAPIFAAIAQIERGQ